MYTPSSPRRVMPDTTDLHVSDVLSAEPEYREFPVRTTGPAAVLVLSQEETPRLHLLASSESEKLSLSAWLNSDPRSREIIAAFYAVFTEDAEASMVELVARASREQATTARLYPEFAIEQPKRR